jgi:hypothetical protein
VGVGSLQADRRITTPNTSAAARTIGQTNATEVGEERMGTTATPNIRVKRSMAWVKARLAYQEAQLRADEVRYVNAGILRPDETHFADDADLREAGLLTPRTSSRARGTGKRPKGQSARSSAKSGDSGSEDGEPEPPARRRLCAFCGKGIPADRSPKATDCSDRHADRDRQRRKRARDRARNQLPPTPTTADFRRMLELTDEERDWLLSLVVCRCNGRHLEFEPGECFRCGRHLPHEVEGGRKLYAAFVASMTRRGAA